jgi:DeoR/GlpR family transcriptional regulator of sugar metabolism
LRNDIIKLIEKEPSISLREISRETGYSTSTINRYYMPLKKIYY